MAKDNELALTSEIDMGKVRQLQAKVDTNGNVINSIVDKLVQDYCKPLDDYMNFIRTVLSDTNNPPTDAELDDFTLNLPVLLYFTGEAQEALGVKEDIAKAVKQELFNESFDKSTGTIADKTAQAELATQNEYIIHVSFSRAYKKVKLRMELGNETLQSVKKVISRRMAEYDMSKVDPGRIGGR